MSKEEVRKKVRGKILRIIVLLGIAWCVIPAISLGTIGGLYQLFPSGYVKTGIHLFGETIWLKGALAGVVGGLLISFLPLEWYLWWLTSLTTPLIGCILFFFTFLGLLIGLFWCKKWMKRKKKD